MKLYRQVQPTVLKTSLMSILKIDSNNPYSKPSTDAELCIRDEIFSLKNFITTALTKSDLIIKVVLSLAKFSRESFFNYSYIIFF